MNESMKNLMFDLSAKKTIYDAETDRVISTSEASDSIRNYCLNELGLTEKSSPRDMDRALKAEKTKRHGLFEMIEEVLDRQISTGWKDDEFFNEFVEEKNLADGDENEFWTDQDVILTVCKVAGSHHDLEFNRVCVARAA